jgi:NDP-sugar pyrophosphorylase family protein
MMARPDVAMVLAAGRGERMRPLSEVVAKPALPLPGGAVISWSMRLAAAAGARRIVVNVWHLADTMEAAVRRTAVDLGTVEVLVSREPELLDTAGGLAWARDQSLLESDGPVLVANGDVVLDLDLEPVFRRHAAGNDAVTLALLPHTDPSGWSRVGLDAAGMITTIRRPGAPEPGEQPLLYPGVMVVSRQALQLIPSGIGGIPDRLWASAQRSGLLGGALVSGRWQEVGRPSAYLETALSLIKDSNRIDGDADIDATADIGSSFVGSGVRVGPRASIHESVVAEGAVVSESAVLSRSVVLGEVVVQPGERLRHEVLTPGCRRTLSST